MVKEVVWVEEVGHGLAAALKRTMQAGDLGELAVVLGSAQHLPRTLREALVFACLASRPIYSVADLAASVHCNRTTLCLQWRKALGEECTLRLVDFLALILLTHSARRKSMGQKTPAIAADLGVHEHTLRRLSKRWGGSTSRPKSEHQQTAINGVFENVIRTHLLRDRVTTAEELARLS
jgi:AraC-like DNA-binding protein